MRKFKVGELQTTKDIEQKLLMGELTGHEVWAFEHYSGNVHNASLGATNDAKGSLNLNSTRKKDDK